VPTKPATPDELKETWTHLSRDFFAIFIGYDYAKPVGKELARIESFLGEHPEFKPAFADLLVKSLQTFITLQKLFQNDEAVTDGSRSTDVYECLMHYLMRREDREKGLPANFLKHLEQAIRVYSWTETKDYAATTRALFHLYKAQANCRQSMDLIRQSLLTLQKLFTDAREFTDVGAFSDLLGELINVGRTSNSLVDAAVYIRY